MEFNFIFNIEETDKKLFFGPLKEEDQFIKIEEHWTMANILVHVGIFKSLTQARKNGFANDIPVGFSDKHFGKKKIRIAILNWR